MRKRRLNCTRSERNRRKRSRDMKGSWRFCGLLEARKETADNRNRKRMTIGYLHSLRLVVRRRMKE